MSTFSEALTRRARALNVIVAPHIVPSLEIYVGLLTHWNHTVNLTALPIDELRDEAIDRLLVEPIAAAAHVPPTARDWIDLGTGGGSPAIPIKIALPDLDLTMVESRSRKIAFLREVVRELRLTGAKAEAARFESLIGNPGWTSTADFVTARAVRPDEAFRQLVTQLIRPGGTLMIFETAGAARIESQRLQFMAWHRLFDRQPARVSIYRRTS